MDSKERRASTSAVEICTDLGVVLVPVAGLFTLRVICEQTVVPWVHGAELPRFSIFRSPMDLVGCALLVLAMILAVVLVGVRVHHRAPISRSVWSLVLALAVCASLYLVPGEQWELLMARAHDPRHVPKSWVLGAAASGEVRLLDYLLASGIDVNTRAQHGESWLGAAAASGQIRAATLILARGARLENRTVTSLETPLTEAAQMNHTEMVQLLLQDGANRGARDVTHRSAADWARYNHNSTMAAILDR